MKGTEEQVQSALAWLERNGTRKHREGMTRYAIPSDKAFGVSVSNIQKLAKQLGKSHELALALWETGWYEARMLTAYVDEPARVTPAQMDRWAGAFDNWAIPDTLCFALWDRTPHAWAKVTQWSARRGEFVKRAAFAMLWSLAVHDKQAGNKPFIEGLALIERAATDDRNFVKKAVNMALRAVGKRNAALNQAAIKVAKRLAELPDATPRWIGKDALRELTSPSVVKRLAKIVDSADLRSSKK
jgi:3-methyladenine DNA glycosylase AlkD